MPDKKIYLALQFSKAPKELQAATQALFSATERLDKANAQCEAWRDEIIRAKSDLGPIQFSFDRLLTAWDIGLNQIVKLEVFK